MRHLLRKDLRILKRSPLLLALLIVYPILVAALIGFAIGRAPEQPKVAIYNAIPVAESDILIGGKAIDIRRYVRMLGKTVDEYFVASRSAAVEDVESGDAVAAVVIPRDLPEQLESGFQQGHVELVYSAGDAVRKSYVESATKGLLVDVNQEISRRYADLAVGYVKIIAEGGEIAFLGRSFNVTGIDRGAKLVRELLPTAPPGLRPEALEFAKSLELAGQGLTFADDLVSAIGEPLVADTKLLQGDGRSLSSYAVAVALAISMMFVALLIAAGMLALEHEDNAFARLVRGLVKPGAIVLEKAVLGALCAVVVGLVMLLGMGMLIDLRWERAPLWLLGLAVAGLGFGMLGVAFGALAREVRAASLLSFMLGIPLAVIALVPSGAVAPELYDVLRVVSGAFPFRPGLQTINGVLAPGVALLIPLLHVLALCAAYYAIARLALRRHA